MFYFLSGIVIGSALTMGLLAVIYVPLLNKLRDEICKLKIDLMHK